LPEEQDIECPDEKLERDLVLATKTDADIGKIFALLEPILHDLKEGNLKRVAKSTFNRKPKKSHNMLLDVYNSSESDKLPYKLRAGTECDSRQQRQVHKALDSERSRLST